MNFQLLNRQIYIVSRLAHLFCINHGSGTPEVNRPLHNDVQVNIYCLWYYAQWLLVKEMLTALMAK